MICDKCKEEGLKSTVWPGSTMSTAMSINRYYDEDGNYHLHDGNVSSSSFSCSNGHSWSVKTKSRCPSVQCKWNRNEA